jgi:hypothetical protein
MKMNTETTVTVTKMTVTTESAPENAAGIRGDHRNRDTEIYHQKQARGFIRSGGSSSPYGTFPGQ